MKLQIRKYNKDDLADVLACWEKASLVGHPFVTQDFINSERRNIPNKYLPNGETWVAQEQDTVIGFTILHGNEVGALFVDPAFHGSGIGYALMNKAQEIHSDLKVEVFEKNTNGCSFYYRYGFEFVSKYKHEETGLVILRLEYALPT